MQTCTVKIKTDDESLLPAYKTEGAAGADLMAAHGGEIAPFKRSLIKTGIYLELPAGYEAQVRPRSGLALKNGVTVLNTPGTIDSDYRGEICVIIVNLSDEAFIYKKGDRIAQIIFAPVTRADFELISDLSETERNDGGFGHTGI